MESRPEKNTYYAWTGFHATFIRLTDRKRNQQYEKTNCRQYESEKTYGFTVSQTIRTDGRIVIQSNLETRDRNLIESKTILTVRQSKLTHGRTYN